MISYLVDEMKIIKLQLSGQSVPTVEFSDKPGLEDHATSLRLEEDDLDNTSTVSS